MEIDDEVRTMDMIHRLHDGMLRDYLAANYQPPAVMLCVYFGFAGESCLLDLPWLDLENAIVELKYRHADAMLAERTKDRGPEAAARC